MLCYNRRSWHSLQISYKLFMGSIRNFDLEIEGDYGWLIQRHRKLHICHNHWGHYIKLAFIYWRHLPYYNLLRSTVCWLTQGLKNSYIIYYWLDNFHNHEHSTCNQIQYVCMQPCTVYCWHAIHKRVIKITHVQG